jgi:hypothetical protein
MWFAMLAAAEATEIGESRPFGLGVQLGAPSGLSGKLYLGGRRNAVDFTVGGAYEDDLLWDGIWAQVSYHWHLVELTSGEGVTIPFRAGIGGFLSSVYYGYAWDGDVVLGARAPFGLDFDLEVAPVQFWVEVAVDLTVLPPLRVGMDGGIGARYYF